MSKNLCTSNNIENQKISGAVNNAIIDLKDDINRNNINKKEELQSFTKNLTLTLVFMWNSALQKSLISVFQEFFACINKIYILAGRLGTRLSFYEI